jgi:hypothetical protein
LSLYSENERSVIEGGVSLFHHLLIVQWNLSKQNYE